MEHENIHLSLASPFGLGLCEFLVFVKSFEQTLQPHIIHAKNHVLAPIVGKGFEQKFFSGFVFGVLEGLINRGSFWFFIFAPSSVHQTRILKIFFFENLYLFTKFLLAVIEHIHTTVRHSSTYHLCTASKLGIDVANFTFYCFDELDSVI